MFTDNKGYLIAFEFLLLKSNVNSDRLWYVYIDNDIVIHRYDLHCSWSVNNKMWCNKCNKI